VHGMPRKQLAIDSRFNTLPEPKTIGGGLVEPAQPDQSWELLCWGLLRHLQGVGWLRAPR
jgi:hypothetical protein